MPDNQENAKFLCISDNFLLSQAHIWLMENKVVLLGDLHPPYI